MSWNGKTDHLEPKVWECKVCDRQYTNLEKGYGVKCWLGHRITRIEKGGTMPEIPILRAQIEVLQTIKDHVQGLINDRVEAIWEAEKESRKGTPDEAA